MQVYEESEVDLLASGPKAALFIYNQPHLSAEAELACARSS